MSSLDRRAFIGAIGGATLLSGCITIPRNDPAVQIDARVDAALDYLYTNYPESAQLADKAAGILVMPVITKAGLGLGGAYGRGALRIKEVTVDYYSATSASVGFQFGMQQYSHALFFMTEEALHAFRTSPGYAAGSDVEFVLGREAENLSNETTIAFSPVVAWVFESAGVTAGATIKGTKYTRIIQ